MIVFENVSKQYETAEGVVRALDDVSLSIETGEFVALRGPSGCGKSTLLALAGGLALPTSGQVTVGGELVSAMNASLRAEFRAVHIGFVFQMFHLLPYLNVLDNVTVAAHKLSENEARQRAEDLIESFGLSARSSHRPGELSAGERQRVAMARALINRPQYLLADEPTGNLDDDNAAAVLALMQKFHQDGGTVLLVTHEERAARFAKRTIPLARGRLVEQAVGPTG